MTMSKTMHGVSSTSSARECCARVWQAYSFRSVPCTKLPKVERDGKWFCTIHDPVRNEERNKAREAKWQAEWRESAKRGRLQSAAPAMLDALRAVEPLMIPGMNWTDETGELVKSMVRAAIAMAVDEAVEETPSRSSEASQRGSQS
jgi:uncharacterized Zn finger protein (UPF0148 family)